MTEETQRLDVALVARGLFASRAKAQEAILAGLVNVNGKPAAKPSEQVAPSADIQAEAPYPYVSRGGVKLAEALNAFHYVPQDRICLDIGASTGGFTDVLLRRGAAKVYAIDVGDRQLHETIAANPRVVSFEKTDARNLAATMFEAPPSLIVFDVSFISLKLLLAPVLKLAAPQADMVALIKPQFEAGPRYVRKGIVRDREVHAIVCDDIAREIERLGWKTTNVIVSPIDGGDGNREFLIGASRG
ncbi:TlyA family RNA methyltransferase [Methylovirgula sp. 4M-Z18]|uniref:TlyA family RNA methyltransferase n=1 Tax=Methylovirgula sp. 4M-Z18 TaxID=2293567 RepID=UPI000E2E4966|nr:TlyA family RNA methyltransferase [Methylovirgula sp. 4M-Z18]RFB80092.1 TlyA family RNA methyltransferase [Methylovirgula sp. 4M-Z18]